MTSDSTLITESAQDQPHRPKVNAEALLRQVQAHLATNDRPEIEAFVFGFTFCMTIAGSNMDDMWDTVLALARELWPAFAPDAPPVKTQQK